MTDYIAPNRWEKFIIDNDKPELFDSNAPNSDALAQNCHSYVRSMLLVSQESS